MSEFLLNLETGKVLVWGAPLLVGLLLGVLLIRWS